VAISRETIRLARRLVAGVGDQVDQATRDLTAAWLTAWSDLEPLWRELVDDITAAGANPTAADLSRERRLRTMLDRTERTLEALTSVVDQRAGEAVQRAAALTLTAEPVVMASQLPTDDRAAGTERFRAAVMPRTIDAIVRRTTETIHALTRPLPDIAVSAIKRELVIGIAAGTNPRETAGRMVGRLRGAFDLPLTRALNISRTETLDAYRATTGVVQAANDDVLAAWIWLARLGTRCCPGCWAMHGTEHPLSDPGPIDHQQGRCGRMPKLRTWAELGLPGTEPAPAVPDAETTFRALPDVDQLAVMGPDRLALLRAGSIGWADLATRRSTTGWRDSYAATPVNVLATLANSRS
jgi:hypothetical protein